MNSEISISRDTDSPGCTPELLKTKGSHAFQWCPDICPVTFRPFFMWIEHSELGWVPTYGGPLDSYTIPSPCLPESGKVDRCEIEYTCFRFDHDEGCWIDGEEDPGVRSIKDEHLLDLDNRIKIYANLIKTGNQIIHDQVITMQCALIELSQKKPTAAEEWLFNNLWGPGHVPTTDDPYHDNANHWWGANCYNPLKKCACGNPAHIISDNITACSDECWEINEMMVTLKDMNS